MLPYFKKILEMFHNTDTGGKSLTRGNYGYNITTRHTETMNNKIYEHNIVCPYM